MDTESEPNGGPFTLVLSHGRLADELVAAAERINGSVARLEALSLDWDDSLEDAKKKLGRVLQRVAGPAGVLILTDMFGGTPHNVAQHFARPGQVEVVTGVNLPMVLRLACLPQAGLGLLETAAWIRQKGRRSICHCTPEGAAAAQASTR